jgi:hypothetical protein
MRTSNAFGMTTVGEILRETLTIYRGHFVLFLSLAAVIYAPYYLFLSAIQLEGSVLAMAGAIVPGVVAQALASAMMIWVIVRTTLGHEVGFVNALGSLTPSLVVRLLGTTLLVTAGVTTGFFLFIVPGLVLLVWFSLVNQVVVVEGMAYIEAVRRCLEIIRGSWWRVLSVLLVLVVINLTALVVLNSLFGEAAVVLGQLFGILFVPFWSIALTLLYFDLRTEKEGFAIESLGALISNEQ